VASQVISPLDFDLVNFTLTLLFLTLLFQDTKCCYLKQVDICLVIDFSRELLINYAFSLFFDEGLL